jgi:hypothetical protein
MTSQKDKGEPIVFVQKAIDYNITGSRSWEDLSGQEQDEYILACFMGETARLGIEQKFDLLDRTASSVADGLLGPFRQYDINTGQAHYLPESPDRALRVLTMRMAVLRDTPLGERLSRARSRRAHGKEGTDEYLGDPKLRFYSVGPRGMVGLHVLDDKDYGGLAAVNPYQGAWNDWSALELQQGKELHALKNERWESEIAASAPHRIARTPLPATPQIADQLPTPLVASAKRSRAPVVVAGAMLAWALLPFNPYAYYTILRWVCAILFLKFALEAKEEGSQAWAITFGATVILYNPLFPLALGRPAWSLANLATIALLSLYSILGWRKS